MPQITPLAGKPRQSIAPDTTAPGAPTITAPGAPAATSPVSPGTRRREAEMREKYEDIEERYGRSRYVGHRREEFKPKPAPDTPVSDAYVITMQGKEPSPGTSLGQLVIREEQRKRGDWIYEETVRAHTLPAELQQQIATAQYHEQMAEYDRQMAEYNKAAEEQRELDKEAQKYGHATHDELMAAIREEKAIRRANELGAALTEVQLEAQRAARGGVPQADYLATLETQRAEVERLQRSLQASFGIDVPATSYVAEVESIMAAREPVVMRTMAAPAPYQVTIFPGLKLTSETVPPYREPVPQDPIEQISYHLAPIIDKFRADTRLDSPAIDIAMASASLSRAAMGRPSPIVAPIAEQLIREPTRPISALVEMPGELALGLYRIPTVAVPHYAAHPEELPALPGKIVSGIGEEFAGDPAGFATKFVGMGYLSGPAISAVRPVTTPITAGIREFSIVARTAPEMRPFVRGTSRIGRYSEGVYSTMQEAPVLSAAANVGDRAGVILDALAGEPHAFYGSVVETGQMPRTVTLQRTGRVYTPTPSDVDVFVSRPIEMAESLATRMGPGYRAEGATVVRDIRPGLSAHAVDIHAFPAGYPDAPKGISPVVSAGSEVIQAPHLPFDFMPRELLKTGPVTQEYLYTQLQRKATSIIGQPRGYLAWEPGPPAYRMKDIASTLIEADHLIGEGQKQLAGMSGIRRLVFGRQIRKLEEGYNLLAGTEFAQTAMAEARGLSVGGVSPPILAPAPARVSPTIAGTGAGMGVLESSPLIAETFSSPVVSPTLSPGIKRMAISPTITSPTVRSPAVRTRSPTLSPGIKRMAISPTITSPTVRSPKVTSPDIIKIGSPDVGSPNIRLPDSPAIRRLPRTDTDGKRGKIWEEWMIHYADRPTPHARIEEAYTDLLGPRIRPAKMITNLQRITLGTPPKAPKRPPSLRIGRPVRRATRRPPWDITLPKRSKTKPLIDLSDPLGLFGTPKKRRRRRR